MTRRLAVLASGRGSNLQAVLDACAQRTIAADVVVVVSDRADALALDRARAAGVPAVHLAPGSGESREDYDQRLADALGDHAPDVVVLAGWMRLLTSRLLDRFPDRVVNLHPALPGELPGLRAIERAHAEAVAGRRARTGVMVHLVPDEGVDDGPVLAAVEVPILAHDTLAELTARVHAVEHSLLVDVLAGLCAHEAPTRPPVHAAPSDHPLHPQEPTT